MPILSSVRRTGREEPSTSRMISSFSDAGYLIPRLPHPRSCFFEKTQLERLLGNNLLQLSRLTTQILDLAARGRPRRIAGKPPLAGLQELLGPTVVKALGNPLAPAQFRNAVLAAQAIQHNADLLLCRVLLPRRPADVFHDPLGRHLGRLGFLSHLRFSMEL